MKNLFRTAEGSAGDEALEGAGKAKRSPVPTIDRGCCLMHDVVTSAEGSASDEALEGAGEAKRSPVPTIEGVAV